MPGCDKCFSCQKCYEGQDDVANCENCFTCQKCDSAQDNCENCFKCQRCVDAQGGGSRNANRQFGITYFLFPTNECNLRCKYCYATKNPFRMTEEIYQATLKFLFEIEEKRIANRMMSVQFFGGEPTMMWDMLVRFVTEGNTIAAQKGMTKPRWGMTTNGTLLNEERIVWLKEQNMNPLFSIDGRPETHDKYRLTVDGTGSSKLIPWELIKKYFPNCEIRPTIMPDTVGTWMDDLDWFHSQGFYTVATEVAYEADWNGKAWDDARRAYNAMADRYIRLREQGQKCWFKFIDDGRNCLGDRKQTGPICGIGKNTVAINAKGDLFACQRYASFADKELAMGNVFEGFDTEKLAWWNDMKREYMSPQPTSGFKCETCPALWKCRGGCNAMNFQCNGDRRIVLENHCKFQRLWAEIALRALAATGELWDGTFGADKSPPRDKCKMPTGGLPSQRR